LDKAKFPQNTKDEVTPSTLENQSHETSEKTEQRRGKQPLHYSPNALVDDAPSQSQAILPLITQPFSARQYLERNWDRAKITAIEQVTPAIHLLKPDRIQLAKALVHETRATARR
jgi:hypothetical protein